MTQTLSVSLGFLCPGFAKKKRGSIGPLLGSPHTTYFPSHAAADVIDYLRRTPKTLSSPPPVLAADPHPCVASLPLNGKGVTIKQY